MKATGLPAAAYRLIAFNDFLQNTLEPYELAGILDTDLIFQLDILDVVRTLTDGPRQPQLFFAAEDPISLNGDCQGMSIENFTIARLRASRCRYSTLAPRTPATLTSTSAAAEGFWAGLGCTWRLNLGTIFGTRGGLIRLVRKLADELQGEGSGCWDQGVLNVLVYTGAINVSLLVWDYFRGPVKTLDVGSIRDRQGRFLNEDGERYALVHQFKRRRHRELYTQMSRMLPPASTHQQPWSSKLFHEGMKRLPVRDSLYEQRSRIKKTGFVHPALALRGARSERGLDIYDPGDHRNPLPRPTAGAARPIAQGAHCAVPRYKSCAGYQPANATHSTMVEGNAWISFRDMGYVWGN
jgi:hypothetical protein